VGTGRPASGSGDDEELAVLAADLDRAGAREADLAAQHDGLTVIDPTSTPM